MEWRGRRRVERKRSARKTETQSNAENHGDHRGMQPFTKHTGLVAPLDRVNVDTDQMVPKQFLKFLTREGYGRVLFYDWRYLPGEKPNPDFVLNYPRYKGASILLARANFGCGSSREHAPWAILDYGFERFWRRAMRTFSTTTASRTEFCPSRSRTSRWTSFSSARNRMRATG